MVRKYDFISPYVRLQGPKQREKQGIYPLSSVWKSEISPMEQKGEADHLNNSIYVEKLRKNLLQSHIFIPKNFKFNDTVAKSVELTQN